MVKRSREKIALVLSALLGLGAILAMGWYIFAGHGWNVAASNIDDSIGQMQGYTVVLYEGTRDADLIQAAEQQRKALEAKEAAQAKGQGSSAPVANEGVTGEVKAQDPSQDASLAIENGDREAAEEATIVDIELEADEITLESLAESYEAKGAEVYCLAMGKKGLYREPFVVSKGTRRIGLGFVETPVRLAATRIAAKRLAHEQADFTVMITDDPTVRQADLSDIDVILCDKADEEPVKGSYAGSAFCVDTPYVGEIGALIISPSGVLSSKTIGPS